jgi:hypothetical protein
VSTDDSDSDGVSDDETVTAKATYTELRNATVDDFIKQGRAFDVYAEDGRIVDNILGLVKSMQGKNGDVGQTLICIRIACRLRLGLVVSELVRKPLFAL